MTRFTREPDGSGGVPVPNAGESGAPVAREYPSCPRCHMAVTIDRKILDDAQRQGITLDFLPLRCQNGHSARLERPPRRVRFVPVCRFCDRPVFERTTRGKQFLNHPACMSKARYDSAAMQEWAHQYVEVEV